MESGFRLFVRYLGDRMRHRLTWITAAIVGTLINLYGQLLVPWLRGDDPIRAFTEHFRTHLGECVASIVIAYVFPFCVSAIAAAFARYEVRALHSRALFPDQKPDPVFRALVDGTIVDAGEPTRQLFRRFGVERAQDVLGEEVWARVAQAGQKPATPLAIATQRVPGRFVLTYSPAPMGAINVYLAQLEEGTHLARDTPNANDATRPPRAA